MPARPHEADAHHPDFHSPTMAELVEPRGEVLSGLVNEAVSRLAELSGPLDAGRVLDVGCGPGVATCYLAERFASALVIAVDGSAAMLDRARERVERLGLADRVELRLMDLPDGLADLPRVDAVWASQVLHHLDAPTTLRRIRELLEPGGALAVLERAGPMRFLPDDTDLGRPGIWERLDRAAEAWFADMRAQGGATASSDYASMIEEAGFELVADEKISLVEPPPLGHRPRRFAQMHLGHAREQLEPYADAADLRALDSLVDEHAEGSIMRRADALLSASRRLYLARA